MMTYHGISISRRRFMQWLMTAAASYPLSALAEKRQQASAQASTTLAEPWLTIAAVQQHLFPADDTSPGASDINALHYLQTMIMAPDIEQTERDFIINGEKWLNGIAHKTQGKKFIELDEAQKEAVLRQIENSRAGENWLATQLGYVIEALLSDPVYGGNPNGMGWNWLKHQPGYPTPGIEKMYYKLGQVRYRRTKA